MNSSNEYKPVLFWSLLGAAFVLGLFYVRGQMLMRAAGQEGVVPAGSAPQALFMVYVLAAGCMALLLLAAAVLYRSRRFPPRAAVAASEEDINKTIKELHAEISGRKKVEQALRESEEQKQLIINNILDVVVQISTKGIIQYVSPSVKTLHGYDPERLKGKPMTFATPYEEIPRAWGVLRRVLRGEEVKDFVIKQRDISGAIRVKEIHLSPIKKEGKVVGAQGIMRDISERIKLEERLSEQKVYLEKVIDALQHPFY
ncbi:MAG: PAS domain S-box protein, partial [Candidatus Omnitrophica bacterium]|nr:PAS domain S-box protein [Candidatus Omnitrophota bacterium]